MEADELQTQFGSLRNDELYDQHKNDKRIWKRIYNERMNIRTDFKDDDIKKSRIQ